MLNLGICRRCPNCKSLSPALVGEDGLEVRRSCVDCCKASGGLGWLSNVPDGCPYVLEHKMTEEAVEDLGQEEEGG